MSMFEGLKGRNPRARFFIGTSSTGFFSFVSPLLLVFGAPFVVPYSFTPADREVYLSIKGIITRMSLLIPFNSSTGTNFAGVRLAGVNFPRLVTLPPLSTGQFRSPDLTSLNLKIEENELFAIIADRSGILNAGELWQPLGIFVTIENRD